MSGRAFAVIVLLILGGAPSGAAELTPPFGLKWGGTPGRLVEWAKRFQLDLLVKAPGDDPQMSVLLITPANGTLPNHEATMLEARFIEGRLFEVVVHYTYPGRPAEFVQGRFVELKKLLSKSHGEFKLSGQQKAVRDGISTKSDAYHLEPAPGFLLMLARTEVTDVKRGDVAKRFSVVYHSDQVLDVPRKDPVAASGDPKPIRLPERK